LSDCLPGLAALADCERIAVGVELRGDESLLELVEGRFIAPTLAMRE
jgi:hypothetical protein